MDVGGVCSKWSAITAILSLAILHKLAHRVIECTVQRNGDMIIARK